MNQFVHVYKHKILGGHLGADVLLPVVAISGSGTVGPRPPVVDQPRGPGTIWSSAPSSNGSTRSSSAAPSSSGWSWTSSCRPASTTRSTRQPGLQPLDDRAVLRLHLVPHAAVLHLLADPLHVQHGERRSPSPTLVDQRPPGQAFHFNYSFEYEFFKNFRGAVAGYYLKQITDDEGQRQLEQHQGAGLRHRAGGLLGRVPELLPGPEDPVGVLRGKPSRGEPDHVPDDVQVLTSPIDGGRGDRPCTG